MSDRVTCDASFFKGGFTIIIVGGESAMEAAMVLAKFAERVAIVHRRDDFHASHIALERARSSENVEWLTPFVVEQLAAADAGSLELARLRNVAAGSPRDLEIAGAFVSIGPDPQSQLAQSRVDADDAG